MTDLATDQVSGINTAENIYGVQGGATFGYNWQFTPNLVVGAEGTFDGIFNGNGASSIFPGLFEAPRTPTGCRRSRFASGMRKHRTKRLALLWQGWRRMDKQ